VSHVPIARSVSRGAIARSRLNEHCFLVSVIERSRIKRHLQITPGSRSHTKRNLLYVLSHRHSSPLPAHQNLTLTGNGLIAAIQRREGDSRLIEVGKFAFYFSQEPTTDYIQCTVR